MQFDLFGSSGKTSPEYCPTKQTPSDVCSELWWEQIPHSFQAEGNGGPVRVWLMDPSDPPLGESRMPNISVWPNDASVCSLWQVLETGRIPRKYFLTALACSGILRRAVKRGKELPELLARALRSVVNGGGHELSPALTCSGRGVERTGESRGQDCVVPVFNETGQGFWNEDNIGATVRKGDINGNGGARQATLVPVELSNGHISHCLNAGGMGRIDYETETLVTHAGGAIPVGIQTCDSCEREFPALGSIDPSSPRVQLDGFMLLNTPCPHCGGSASSVSYPEGSYGARDPVAFRTSPNDGAYETGDRIDALTTGTDPTSHLIAFSCKDSGSDAGDISPTLRAMEFDKSHANGGGQVAVCMTGHISHSLTTRSAAEEDGTGRGCPIVAHPDTLAFNLRGREGGAMPEVSDVASLRSADGGSSRSYIAQPWAVRRLTPIETAKLQGFPATYCHIPRKPRKIDQDEAEHYLGHGIEAYLDGEQWMTKAAADGSIYRAHGNSMAVNVMRWLGLRIQACSKKINPQK